MNKSYKKFLFFSLAILFVILVPVTILYSQGYRFDFNARKIVQTGGFYFRVTPSGARIFIENGPSKKTSFFSSGAFIGGLLPKTYQVTIERDGYHSWNKALTVFEKRVTEAKNIHLFPLHTSFELLLENAIDFFPHPQTKDIIIKSYPEKRADRTESNPWQIELLNFQSKQKTKLVSAQELVALLPKTASPELLNFSNLEWSPNKKEMLIETVLRGQKKYFLIDFTAFDILAFSLDIPVRADNVLMSQARSKEVFYLAPMANNNIQADSAGPIAIEQENGQKNAIFRLKITESEPELKQETALLPTTLKETEIIAFTLADDNIFWLSGAGLANYGKIGQTNITLIEVLNKKPYSISPNLNYRLVADYPARLLLKENEALYYLNPRIAAFEKIFDVAKDVKISPDRNKIAIRTDYQVWVFFPEKDLDQPARETGEKILLSAFNDYIDNIFWLNSHYLIFQEKDSIKIAEIDNRSNVNIVEIASFPGLKMFWNNWAKTLFVLSKNTLYYSTDLP